MSCYQPHTVLSPIVAGTSADYPHAIALLDTTRIEVHIWLHKAEETRYWFPKRLDKQVSLT